MPPTERVEQLLESLKSFVESKSGFGNRARKIKFIEKIFRDFDRDNSGSVDEDEFLGGLIQMNVVGCSQTVLELFDRFDDDCSGRISYLEFAEGLFPEDESSARGNRTAREAQDVVQRVKSRILQLVGKNAGIRGCTRILRQMDQDGNNTLDEHELREGLEMYGVHIADSEIDRLVKHFDKDGSGRITIEEFLRGLRGDMKRNRRKLVRSAWDQLVLHLNMDGPGDSITLNEMASFYDVSKNPKVIDGTVTKEEAMMEFIAVWDKNSDGIVDWKEFLDYYKDLSAGIEDDDYWELMIRNAWHLSGGEGWCENTTNIRCLVTYSDGSQRIVEITDDFGVSRSTVSKRRLIEMLHKQGVSDIADVSLHM